MKKYSIIIPVYNRPEEIDELLEGLLQQDFKDFEVIVVEDGSVNKCDHIIEKYKDQLDLKYYFKSNSGPGLSRNYGMSKATGEYFVIFDSDCLIPPDYLSNLETTLKVHHLDAYGGPEKLHGRFTRIQKAITYSMTSFITTGGIRGKKKRLDSFQARSFNMGFHRSVFEKIGGFSDAKVGEDGDMSNRIKRAGFKMALVEKAFVYHKRRISFLAFVRQVYKFGIGRNFLMKWYPESKKLVFFLPALFLLGSALLVLLSVLFLSWLFLLPLLLFVLIVFVDALLNTKSLVLASLSIIASFIQLYGYGFGFLEGYWNIFILKRDERKAFSELFFKSE